MAGLFKVKELEARKRALITESEVYRETLKLEVQNLQLYSIKFRRRLSLFSRVAPLVAMAAPLTTLLMPRRENASPPGKRGLFGTAILGWRLYRQFGPMLGVLIHRFAGRKNLRSSIRKDYQQEA